MAFKSDSRLTNGFSVKQNVRRQIFLELQIEGIHFCMYIFYL